MKKILFILLITGISHAKETRTKIAVIDTGIAITQESKPYMCEDGVKNMTQYSRGDNHGHGSNIVDIIGSRIDHKKFCIVSYKVWDKQIKQKIKPSSDIVMNFTIKALRHILVDNFRFVNISMSGGYSYEEFKLLRRLTLRGTEVSVAAGNDGIMFTEFECSIYHACYKLKHNYYVVSAKDSLYSNKGNFTVKEQGKDIKGFGLIFTGSSQATAIWTSKLVNSQNKNRHD